MNDLFLRLPDPEAAVSPSERLPLGRVMVNAGLITQGDLVHALDLQRHIDAPLGEILIAEGLVSATDILQMVSRQHNIPVADLTADPPDPSLSAMLPSALCLKYRCVPWLRIGDVLLVGTQHPDEFNRLCACLGERGRRLLPVLLEEKQIRKHITALYGDELAQKAATRVPAIESCQSWYPTSPLRKPIALALLAILVSALVMFPAWTITVCILITFVTLVMSTVFKVAAFVAQMTKIIQDTNTTAHLTRGAFPLPKVSVLVPLLNKRKSRENSFSASRA